MSSNTSALEEWLEYRPLEREIEPFSVRPTPVSRAGYRSCGALRSISWPDEKAALDVMQTIPRLSPYLFLDMIGRPTGNVRNQIRPVISGQRWR